MNLINEILARTPKVPIYHYTSQSGLLGIVNNKCMWASRIHYLNDSEEFYLALKMLRNEIQAVASSDSYFIGANFISLGDVDRILSEFTTTHTYICSFSENGDLLSQWRGYCPKGNGFSIGFDFNKLNRIIREQGFIFAPCIYDVNEQRQVIREVVNCFLSGQNDSFSIFHIVAAILKHDTFSEEREWRIILPVTDYNRHQVYFREGISMLTPYLNISIVDYDDSIPIVDVVVGPTPNKDLSLHSATHFVKSRVSVDCDVTLSTIPYRGW
jgi:hypothetical protein